MYYVYDLARCKGLAFFTTRVCKVRTPLSSVL